MAKTNNHEMQQVVKQPAMQADVFNKNCPSRVILNQISNKWALLIIDALKSRRRRNGELLRQIEGISQKMLTQNLRALEAMKIVVRHNKQTIPPHVEYELSALGRSLRQKVAAIDRWVEHNMMEMLDK